MENEKNEQVEVESTKKESAGWIQLRFSKEESMRLTTIRVFHELNSPDERLTIRALFRKLIDDAIVKLDKGEALDLPQKKLPKLTHTRGKSLPASSSNLEIHEYYAWPAGQEIVQKLDRIIASAALPYKRADVVRALVGSTYNSYIKAAEAAKLSSPEPGKSE